MIGSNQSSSYQQPSRQQQQQQTYKIESGTSNNQISPQSKQHLSSNTTVEDLQIELGLLNSKYQNALERLAEKTGQLSTDGYHARIYQLEKEIGREKEKALRVILKLERDLEAQDKRNNFETLKLTSQIESLHAVNAQLQKELAQQAEFNQKDKVLQLALQEKEDAESVVKELRKHNEALLSKQATNRSFKDSEREASILSITQENTLLKSKLLQMEAALNAQTQQNSSMQRQQYQECENLKRDNQLLTQQLESLKMSSVQAQGVQQQIHMQSQTKQELERIRDQLIAQLETAKLQCLNAETKANERQNEVTTVRQQLINAVEERQSILQKYERAVCDKETHSQTVLINSQENTRLKEKLQQLESERDQMYFDLQQSHKYREEQARITDNDNQTSKQQLLRDLQLSRNECEELRKQLTAQGNQLAAIGQIQAQLTQLQTRYVQLEQLNDSLKQANNQLNQQNVYLSNQQSDAGKFSERITQLNRDLEQSERARLALESELKSKEREKEEIRLNAFSSSDQLKRDNIRLSSEVTSIRNEITLRNNEATGLQNTIKELEIKNQQLQAQNDRLIVQEILYQQSQKDLQTKEKMLQAMEAENKQEIEKLKGQSMQLQNSKDLVLSDFIRVEAELKRVSQQQSFSGQLAQAEKDKIQASLASCQSQVAQLLSNNSYIEDKLKAKDLESSSLQEQLEKAKSMVSAVTVDLEETRRILEEITRKYDQSKKECMEVSINYEKLKQQHDYVVLQHETVKHKHEVVSSQCDQLSQKSNDQMRELKIQNEQLSLRVAESMAEKSKIQGELVHFQQENKGIQEQLKMYLAEKLELERRIAQAEKDKHNFLDDKTKLETDKAIVSMQLSKLEREKEQLQQSLRESEKLAADKMVAENARVQAINDLQNARNETISAQLLFSNSAARVKELEESLRKEGVKYSSLLVENGKLEDQFKLKGSQQQFQIDQNNQQYQNLCLQVQLQLDSAERELKECISTKDAKINEVLRKVADLEAQKGVYLSEKEKMQREQSQLEERTKREVASLKEQASRDQAALKYLQEQSKQQLADFKDKATQELKAFEELSQQRGVLLDQKEATIHSLTQQLHSTQRSLIQKSQVQDNARVLADNNSELKELQRKNMSLENEIALITTKSQTEISTLSKQLQQLQLSQQKPDRQLNDSLSLSLELQATKKELEKAYEFIASKKQECLLLSNNYAVIKEELLRVTQEQELLQQQQQEYDGDSYDQSQDNNGFQEESLRTQNEILKQTNRALLLNIVDLEKRSVSTHSKNNFYPDENNNYNNNNVFNN